MNVPTDCLPDHRQQPDTHCPTLAHDALGPRAPRGRVPRDLRFSRYQIFPAVNFVFSDDGHFGLGGVGEGSPPLPPLLFNHCEDALVLGVVQTGPTLMHNTDP